MEKNNVQEIQTNILESLYQIRNHFLEEYQANSVRNFEN